MDLEDGDEEEEEADLEEIEEEEVVSLITKIAMTIKTRTKMSLKMNYDHYNILVIIFCHIYVLYIINATPVMNK